MDGPGARDRVGSSVLDAIGRTPLVELARITRDLEGRILAKLEYLNPGGSKKDRIALRMIRDAETSGALSPGQPVVELTSGNTGTGLAIVCSVTGHPFVAVMSAGNSEERAQMMRAMGAEVLLVDQSAGSQDGHVSGDDLALVETVAARTARDRGAYRADQFHLDGNPAAHEDMGAEIWEQCGGDVDVFCEFVGTGGTLAGVGRFLKAQRASIACYAVEPEGAAVLAGDPLIEPSHRIQGGGYSMPSLPLLDPAVVNGFVQVSDTDAIDATRRLSRLEGVFAGFLIGRVSLRRRAHARRPTRGRHDRHRAGGFRHEVPEHRPVGRRLITTDRRRPAVGAMKPSTRGGDMGVASRKGPVHPALLEVAEERAKSIQNRIADIITRFAGSMLFVYLHITWFSVWIAAGVEGYPYGLLTMIVSLEAIFLSTFVMITQNRQDDARRHLADREWQMVRSEERQNETLIALSGQILELTTRIHEMTLAHTAEPGRRPDGD